MRREGQLSFVSAWTTFFPVDVKKFKKKFTKQLAILSFEVLKVRYFTTLEFGDKKDENCHQNEQVE